MANNSFVQEDEETLSELDFETLWEKKQKLEKEHNIIIVPSLWGEYQMLIRVTPKPSNVVLFPNKLTRQREWERKRKELESIMEELSPFIQPHVCPFGEDISNDCENCPDSKYYRYDPISRDCIERE